MRSSLTCLLLCLAFVAGCGLKDDLYLPDAEPAETGSSEEEDDAESA
jgi:predicted small lipoprotein YifL